MVSNPNELVGQILSGYRLERILGAGATGAVFLGQRVDQPAPPVAIKVLILPWQTTDADREAFQARFRREAQALLELDHPYIPKLLGFGIETNYSYLILQYIDNGSLFTRLARGPLPFDEIARYTQQLAGALDYAHSRNLIHRDIKPANVLLDSQGNAYLSDFSIVRLFTTDAQKGLTSTGQSIGTPEYMSPEQMRGIETGPTSDIYSLGLLVYQMVTGQVPFQGNSVLDLALKHAQEQPPYPRALRPELPPPAEAAIIRALAKNPSDRFQTAAEFAIAFTEGLQNRYTATNPTPTFNPAMNPTPMQTMMPANTSGQYIPQTVATPTPFPSPTGAPTAVPTYVQPGMQVPPPTGPAPMYQPPQSQQLPPRQKRSATSVMALIIVVLLIALVGGGFLAFSGKLGNGGQAAGTNPTATTSGANGTNPTATTSGSTGTNPTATTGSTGANPTATTGTGGQTGTPDYAAAQPGPGCDQNGGTWTPKGIDNIQCGTRLFINPQDAFGYLFLQLPGGKAFSPNNVLSITGNPASGGSPSNSQCVGLAETDANIGYMVDYCGDGSWNIYEISGAGAIIKTYQKNVTSTRQTTTITLTLKGSTLTFAIDTETHTVNNLTPLQPTSVAIVYYDGGYNGGNALTVNNFGYTVLTS